MSDQETVHADIFEEIAAGNLVISQALFHGGRTAPRGTPLIGRDLPNAQLVILRTGWAARVHNLASGKRALLSVYLPGDLIGADCLFYAHRPDEVIALTETAYAVIKRQEAFRLMQQRPVWLSIMQQMVAEQRRADGWVVGLARESALQRMAGLVLGLHHRLRGKQIVSGNSFHLPLTQQDIGDHLGLTVVHVNRVARALRESGVLVIRDRMALIMDMARLKRLALRSAPDETLIDDTMSTVVRGGDTLCTHG